MSTEPVARKFSHSLERAGFLEEMRGARHDLESHVSAHLSHRIAIHLNHGRIEATDDTGIPRSPGNRRSPIGTRTGVVERLASTSRAIVPLFFELRPLCA
jgi:hypothetical protein